MHVSQLMHSLISMRRGGFRHLGLRSRAAIRSVLVGAPTAVDRTDPHPPPDRGGHRPALPRLPASVILDQPDEREHDVAKHPFLSDDWMTEARTIRENYRGKGAPAAHSVRMNLRISDVPFGEGQMEAHVDTSSGELEMDLGHLEAPDLTVGVDYATAKAIFVDQNPQAGMQAFMAGKVKVEGDMTKLMAMQAVSPDPVAMEMAGKIKDITAD